METLRTSSILTLVDSNSSVRTEGEVMCTSTDISHISSASISRGRGALTGWQHREWLISAGVPSTSRRVDGGSAQL